jgi:GDP-L-fucose synthase
MLSGVKALVAGASGLIGSNLIARLLAEGAKVRATLHRKQPVIEDRRIEYVRCDLTRPEDCKRAVEGMQHVYLCAASTSGAAAINATPMIHVTPNVLINSLMLEAAYQAGVEKFLWLGSTVAYPQSDRPMREEQLMEGEPYEKYFYAGWAKRFTEVLCRMYGEKLSRTMTTTGLTPTNVHSQHDALERGSCRFGARQCETREICDLFTHGFGLVGFGQPCGYRRKDIAAMECLAHRIQKIVLGGDMPD